MSQMKSLFYFIFNQIHENGFSKKGYWWTKSYCIKKYIIWAQMILILKALEKEYVHTPTP